MSMASSTESLMQGGVRMECLDNTQFFIYDEVKSTMDVARDILKCKSGVPDFDHGKVQVADMFVVLAKRQVSGRGSRGRGWAGSEGNLFMTLVIKQSTIPCPLMFLPLRVGTLVSPHIRFRVKNADTPIYLKWPNDVLINKEKVCGTLVEIENGRILIGIGCNIMSAPQVPTMGPDRGRSATCLHAHNEQLAQDHEAYKSLAADIASGFREWLSLGPGSDSGLLTVSDFEWQMDKHSTQRIRSGEDADKEVMPLRLNPDGSLYVRMLDSGEEKSLLCDYLF